MTKKRVEDMNYVDLLSYIEEVNRCPGGKRSIVKMLNTIHLPVNPKILEIGSNTGFTSMELSKLLKDAEIIGIDVNQNAVEKSEELLSREVYEVKKNISFQLGDASNLEFDTEYFDLIVTGGANTFVSEEKRSKAIQEYKRVLKPNGFLSITQLFYDKPVPKKILDELEGVLGFRIKPWRRSYWLNLFLETNFELFEYKEYELQERSVEELNQYVDYIIENSPTLKDETSETVEKIKRRWFEIMAVFNKNHRYLSYMTVVLRNSKVEEQREFFFEKGVDDPWIIRQEEEYWYEN